MKSCWITKISLGVIIFIAGIFYLMSFLHHNKLEIPPSQIAEAQRLPVESRMNEIYKVYSSIPFYDVLNSEAMEWEKFGRVGQIYNLSSKGIEANKMLIEGNSQEAISKLKSIDEKNRTDAEWELLGIAYLRYGEQLNCLDTNNSASCLFPISSMGIHRLKAGGKEASKIFLDLSLKNPSRFDWRWLLNISAMVSGELDTIPEHLKMLPGKLEREDGFPHFENIARSVGLTDSSLAGGIIMDDFNNDGLLDIVNNSDRKDERSLRLFINKGDGTFDNNTKEAGLLGIPSGLNILQADYDNDGYLDILILRGAWMRASGAYPITLLHNLGNGKFLDVTKEAGLLQFAPTQAAVFSDFHGSGNLDLFVGCEAIFDYRCESKFYKNLGDGRFKDITKDSGINISEFVKGTIAMDYNDDGREDLIVSDFLNQKIYIYKNLGTNPATKNVHFKKDAELSATFPFSLASFDFDNDGWFDLLVPGSNTNLSAVSQFYFEENVSGNINGMKLFRNNHGVFQDITNKSKLSRATMTMGLNFGDLDNDGFVDFYLGTGGPGLNKIIPNLMFKNINGKNFKEITNAGGFGNLQKGHGIAFADYDNDGQLDVYSNLGGMISSDYYQDALFHNPGGNNNSWVKIRLNGDKSNKFGIGAKIAVTTDLGVFYRHMDTGGSFGANPLLQHFGLGESHKIKKVEVEWPGQRAKQSILDLKINRSYIIYENKKLAGESSHI